jgi:WhiB family redox-sensing transcriptional regulator
MFRDDPANTYEFDLASLTQRPEWHSQAACRGMQHINFYPVRGENAAPALAICATCTVQDECLAQGVRNNERGVWGGSTARQRRQIRTTSAVIRPRLDATTLL